MDLQEAIDAGRLFSSGYPDFTWESRIDRSTIEALRARGHNPVGAPMSIGSVQAALRGPDGEWIGGADARRGGAVVRVASSESRVASKRSVH